MHGGDFAELFGDLPKFDAHARLPRCCRAEGLGTRSVPPNAAGIEGWGARSASSKARACFHSSKVFIPSVTNASSASRLATANAAALLYSLYSFSTRSGMV